MLTDFSALSEPNLAIEENTGGCNYPAVFLGDVRSFANRLAPGTVQCIVTSPPYWGLRSYGAPDEIGAEETLEEYLDALSEVFSLLRGALADNGTLWLIIGDGYTSGNRKYRHHDKRHFHRAMGTRPKNPIGLKNKDLIGLAWRVAFRLQADGWYLRSESIWHKLNPIPESVKDRPHQSHEHIFLLSKSERYSFDWSALKALELEKFKPSRSVWACSVNTGIKGHAAPFPIELIKPCIVACTKENDLVLDPFAGSGSVGVACLELNRRFVGVEIIEDNFRLAIKRLEAARPLMKKG